MELSKQAQDLFTPKRYKTYYGGRGGCKSWDFAGALLLQGVKDKLFIVCGREVQNTIKQSVHRLLKSRIESEPAMLNFYEVQDQKIVGKNGTEFIFVGLRQQSADNIKSLEGCDRFWIEEGQNVSAKSLELLIPTIRKKGSEIWTSFNPKYESDPIWQEMVVNADPDNSIIRQVSFKDNHWFTDELEMERVRMLKTDPLAYKHIWLGAFDERFQGSVYASQIKNAREAGRITSVPIKQGVQVHTVWDLGKSDYTSIWFFQVIGLEVRVVDFYECNNEELDHYADLIRSKGYNYGRHFLPHDSKHERLGMKLSIKDQLSEMGVKTSLDDIIPALGDYAGISAGRTLLGECYIDADRCKDGLHALNHYHYEYDENRKMFKDKPHHDWASHASDAWKYLTSALVKLKQIETEPEYINVNNMHSSTGWQGN